MVQLLLHRPAAEASANPAAGGGLPDPGQALDDEQLLGLYTPASGDSPFVRFNFVTTLDGAATHGGVSGALGTPADKRLFALLRRLADVILVGAGTVRAEGYAGPLLDDAGQAWRRERGLDAHPAVALVSGRLDLDPSSGLFEGAPVRPLLLTTDGAAEARGALFAEVADVVPCGTEHASPAAAVAELGRRGHRLVHSEGGPTLFGSFQDADLVDSLCLSTSPLLAGGGGRRIVGGPGDGVLRRVRLRHLLEEDGALFAEYRR